MKAQNWSFITNHGLVLSYLAQHPTSTARQVAGSVGVTERTTHKIINDLEAEGYIARRRVGRRNVYRITSRLSSGGSRRDTGVLELREALNGGKLWRMSPSWAARERELALR
ncbi:MAG: winged helix-turn-helix transcriptional regulator [Chloroflexi bacterium]|nr:winged helix-turn-helix transcriptional regulator [Chloroflexota bacterium]